MATKIQDIRATNWQLSSKKIGEIVSGIEDIRQCIEIILTTHKGSLPLNPFFGSDIYQFIDRPVNTAVANISAEILDAITKWEPRVIVKKLLYDIVDSIINYQLFIELVESGETTEVLFYIDYQIQTQQNIDNRNFSHGFSFGFN